VDPQRWEWRSIFEAQTSTNFEPTARGLFDLLINYIDQQSGCPTTTAEAVISLPLPFMESIEEVHHIAYLCGALFWVVKQLPTDDIRLDKFTKLLLKFQEQPTPPGQVRAAYEDLHLFGQIWKDLPQWRASVGQDAICRLR
jgi:hypothetical protein